MDSWPRVSGRLELMANPLSRFHPTTGAELFGSALSTLASTVTCIQPMLSIMLISRMDPGEKSTARNGMAAWLWLLYPITNQDSLQSITEEAKNTILSWSAETIPLWISKSSTRLRWEAKSV